MSGGIALTTISFMRSLMVFVRLAINIRSFHSSIREFVGKETRQRDPRSTKRNKHLCPTLAQLSPRQIRVDFRESCGRRCEAGAGPRMIGGLSATCLGFRV